MWWICKNSIRRGRCAAPPPPSILEAMTVRYLALVLILALLSVARVAAQVPVEFAPGSGELTRDDLEQLLQRYQEAIASPAYSGRVKDAARASVTRIRERLEKGDFKVGDRVALTVQGEAGIPDTLVVEPGPQITLPLFGSYSLDGVLRSELEEYMTQALGRVIRNPVVHAKALMRLSVQGAVGRPGFYVVPADLLVSDALMQAGGLTGNSELKDLRIERGSYRLLEGQAMQDALLQGRTLDQLNLQAGDQIYLPVQRSGSFTRYLQYAGLLASTVYLVVRIKGR